MANLRTKETSTRKIITISELNGGTISASLKDIPKWREKTKRVIKSNSKQQIHPRRIHAELPEELVSYRC